MLKFYPVDTKLPQNNFPIITRPVCLLLALLLLIMSPFTWMVGAFCYWVHKLSFNNLWSTIWNDVIDCFKYATRDWADCRNIHDSKFYVQIHHKSNWSFWMKTILFYILLMFVIWFFKEYKIDCEKNVAIPYKCFKSRE